MEYALPHPDLSPEAAARMAAVLADPEVVGLIVRKLLETGALPVSASDSPLATDNALLLDDAVTAYLARIAVSRAPNTVREYRAALVVLVRLCDRRGLRYLGQLTKGALRDLRDRLAAFLVKRSGATVNKVLRAWKAFFGDARDRDEFAIGAHDLKRALQKFPEPKRIPRGLDLETRRTVLGACLRHDADLGRLPSDSRTPDQPVAALYVTALLTGARADELATLRWDAVRPKGFWVYAEHCKTKTDGFVPFEYAPVLGSVFAALRLRSAGAVYVFGGDRPLNQGRLLRMRMRVALYGAEFTWQACRVTASNAYTVVYGASVERDVLRHGPDVAESNYRSDVRHEIVRPDGAQTLIDVALGMDAAIGRWLGASLKSEVGSRKRGGA